MLRNPIAPDLLEHLDTGSSGDIDFYSQYARHSGGPVLVLLSGTGRVATAIARQGIPVIGLDTDPAMIDLAKRKAQQIQAARAMFVRGETTHFVSESKHPLVIIPNGALGRLLSLDEQRQCLTAARQALGMGGRLVLDMPVMEPGRPLEDEPVMRRLGQSGEKAVVIHRRRRYDPALQVQEEMLTFQWLDGDGLVEKSHYAVVTSRYSTPGEILLLLENCGFAPTVYGGFDRQNLLPGVTRMVVEAQRKL